MGINSSTVFKRKSNIITNKEDIDYLVSLKEEDITLSFVMKNFGNFDKKPKYNPYDLITIPANSYGLENHKNKKPFTTTIGLFIFNKFFIEKELFDLFHYVNKTINKKLFKKLHQEISYAVLEDRIGLPEMKNFLQKTQKFQPYVSIIAPNHSIHLLTSGRAFDKKKREIYNKYKKEIEAGNELAMNKVEEEMLSYAKEYMENDVAMDSYSSNARGSFSNNFKSMFLLKGLYYNPDPSKGPKLLMSNYMDGIDRKEYTTFANSQAAGSFSRSNSTAKGGYMEKIFLSAFQSIVLDEPGTDCGTKRYLNVVLDDNNIELWMYSYIVEGSKLVELTSQNKSKYIGKKVKFRFDSLCESKTGICNKCAGNLFYRLGVRNIGMATPQLASKLKLLNMKKFHSSVAEFSTIDPMKAFGVD